MVRDKGEFESHNVAYTQRNSPDDSNAIIPNNKSHDLHLILKNNK